MSDDWAKGPLPRLRHIDTVPVQQGGQPMLLLRDPTGLTDAAVMVSGAMLVILRMLDGEHTLRELQTAIARQTGELILSDRLVQILRQLDEALLLETPRLQAFRRQRLAEYRAAGVRPCVHAEGGYPREAEAFGEMVAGWLAELPPRAAPPAGNVVGVVAPHIDFQRGGPTYAHAYRDLAANCDADLFVILGTDHHGDAQFAATRADFETPAGRVKTARDALAELESTYVGDLFEGELQHLGEHTIEFQVVLLQHFLGGKRDFEVLPILCGGLDEEDEGEAGGCQNAEVLSLIEALRTLMAGRGRQVCLIASADLSHVGPRFGGSRALTPAYLEKVEQHDRAVLRAAMEGRADEMLSAVLRRHNDTNICGLTSMYVMLNALGECQGELLDYRQATSPDRQQCVTFAAATFRG